MKLGVLVVLLAALFVVAIAFLIERARKSDRRRDVPSSDSSGYAGGAGYTGGSGNREDHPGPEDSGFHSGWDGGDSGGDGGGGDGGGGGGGD